MPLLIVDAMNDAGPWKAFAPDGVTTSTELSLTVHPPPPRSGSSGLTGRASGTVDALNHELRRSLGPLDLRPFEELRLWLYSDRPADGSASKPFFLEMRLGSVAVPLTDPANTWQRRLPVRATGAWESVPMTLGDLPAAVRSAVNAIQFRCIDATTAFNCNIDDIAAVRDEMIGDVDLALQVLLDKVLVLAGAPVPAILHPANGAVGQARPYLEITQYDVAFAPERTQAVGTRGDFTARGYSIRPPTQAYELYYQIAAVADDRASQARMLELALRSLPTRGELLVNGYPLPMEAVLVEPRDRIGGFRSDGVPLFYRVSTRQAVGSSTAVVGAKAVVVDGDVRVPQ